ncbi:MAG: hypothetical protein HC929_01645 [Leptolyngbyaceae cyanobacterium SM2_5_2]|nr:hypothetical protein [Leptolyngbyaceae cyanobacterium SM2_5_2]
MTAVDIRLKFEEPIAIFKAADADCQLAILWQAYDTVGQAFASVAPVALFSQAVHQLIQQLNQVSQDEQLDVLRDILSDADTRFAQAYRALNVNMRLAFWHRLFGRRDWRYPLPLSACQVETLATQALIARLSTMGLNERVNFLRQVVS